jgi:hypothetical protein
VRRLLPAVVAAGILTFTPSAFAAEAQSWPAYGYDTQLTNDVPSTLITVQTARRLRPFWRMRLDGAVVASPLSTRVLLDGAERQIDYITTEDGSVYALNAADGSALATNVRHRYHRRLRDLRLEPASASPCPL